MAGGMPSRHRPGRLPLSARPVIPAPGGEAPIQRRAPARPDGGTGPNAAAGPVSVTGPRPCWVVDHELAPGRWPGLLLEWRKGPQGWRGRVILALAGAEGPLIMEAWLPAGHLRPGGG